MMTREEMKKEAISRMKTLRLSNNAIREFDRHDTVWLSEGIGALYALDDTQIKYVKEVEEKYGGIVYHVIRNFTEFGELLSMLYVSKYDEEWEIDRENISDGYVFCYVQNITYPDCSEFGSIVVRPSIGGLIRAY